MQIDEIGESELAQFVAVRNAVWPNDPDSVQGLKDGKRQAEDMVWLLARRDGEVLGAGIGVVGWHSPPRWDARTSSSCRWLVVPGLAPLFSRNSARG